MRADMRRGARGFTLVEVLIAIVLTGIVVGFLFQLLLGQSRFTASQTGRQVVQDNVRGALELITSELRAVPAQAIVAAGDHSLRVRIPRASGVLCATALGGGSTAWIALPKGTIPLDLPSDAALASVENWGIALDRNPTTNNLAVAQLTGREGTTGPCATSMGITNASADELGVKYSGLNAPVTVATPAAAAVRAFLFQEVEYSVGSSTVGGTTAEWLMRANAKVGGATGTRQPLAGPLLPDRSGLSVGGVTFRYMCDNTVVSAAAATANPALIDKVRVVLAMRSRSSPSKTVRELVDSTTIYLRNTVTAC